jgi:hypothetical protein
MGSSAPLFNDKADTPEDSSSHCQKELSSYERMWEYVTVLAIRVSFSRLLLHHREVAAGECFVLAYEFNANYETGPNRHPLLLHTSIVV